MTHGVEASVTQGNSHRIFRLKQRCYIKAVIQNRFAVIGRCRSQYLIAHLVPVDVQLVQPQTGDVNGSLLHRFTQLELLAEVTCTETTPLRVAIPRERTVITNPATFPVVLGKQSHAPMSRFAPTRFATSSVAFYLPIASDVAFQRLASIRDPNGCIGVYLTRIP